MASVDYFLKIDGIEGESKDSKHTGEIDVLSWSWGETNAGTARQGGGMGAGKVQMQDFHFVMEVCKATPKLIEACATGKHIPNATLTARKAGGDQQEYLKYKYYELLISSYQTGGSGAGPIPNDQISFNYSKMEIEYKEQNQDGTLKGPVKAGYDLKKMEKV